MFPEAEDTPTLGPKRPGDQPVTRFIGDQFPSPEGLIGLGFRRVLRAAMPKTTVNKNGQAFPTENKIRFTKDFLIPPPTLNTMLPKNGHEPQFRRLVTS